MTTDQAIKILNGAIKKPNTIDGYLGQALTMAISALNCSEFPNNSDTISRQAAIDALDEQITQCDKALGSFDISMKDEYAVKVERASLKAYRETLNVLPSAQPEQKWETCFDCPLSHGCPKINGCTNGQAMEYASKVPDNCPISVQSRKGKWIDDGTEFGCCCSECNYTLDDYFYGELREVALTKLMNFYPNCGCRMEEGDSE